VILTIERKKIPPDIEVLEMNGRIILGNSSREVELKLAEILGAHAKKIIFDLSGVTILDSNRHWNFGGVPGKDSQAGARLHTQASLASWKRH